MHDFTCITFVDIVRCSTLTAACAIHFVFVRYRHLPDVMPHYTCAFVDHMYQTAFLQTNIYQQPRNEGSLPAQQITAKN
jgi:hypothetical protein